MFRRRGRSLAREGVDPALDFTDPTMEAALAREVAAAQAAAAPLVRGLRDAGLSDLADIGDLANDPTLDYREQVPVLVSWLPRADNVRVRVMIVRALAEPWAKDDALELMLLEFRDLDKPEHYRWAVGNALAAYAAPDLVETFITLARDRRLGPARQMIIQGLGRTRDDRAFEPLVDLLRDPEHEIDAMIGLGLLGHPNGARHIRPYLDDPDDWVRDEARQALMRLRPERSGRPD